MSEEIKQKNHAHCVETRELRIYSVMEERQPGGPRHQVTEVLWGEGGGKQHRLPSSCQLLNLALHT